jgi:hypothetical protein
MKTHPVQCTQVEFYRVVVMPLLETFTSHFQLVRPLLTAAQANLQHWRMLANQQNEEHRAVG